ncbi:MAG: NAD-dependent succinate-semialdehyde dehydrogenase [Candidatus Nitrosocosmicus sp.]|nr:NAD-dependent succinate-semialdehyde dehydrogenase [Candidatus Nitrosocosmicus sp.]MDN5866847.1 NAD-dependent succinate-semialdehyde dehydrogenase [Candidatus Nitrosocosmicus sp.]
MTIKTINPVTEEIIQEYDNVTKDTIINKTKKAKEEFYNWKKDLQKRVSLLHDFAQQIRKDKETLAKTATIEIEKPIKESRSEIEKCAWAIEYFADNGSLFVPKEAINADARKTVIAFEPIETIASIMPWNFPYWQALRFAAPSLMVGNTTVLKPSSATMQCGIEIENTFNKIGMPEGVFQTLVGDSGIVETLISSEYVDAVTFTGSVSVGSKVAQMATSKIKKTVLELGGSDPFIVLEDADIDKASTAAVKGRFINCGQSCIASKRFIVAKKIANEFIEKFVQKVKKLKVGNPLSDDTDIGPLVNVDGLKKIDQIVNSTIKEGAEILTRGKQIDGKGYFYEPTVLKNVTTKMNISQEEVFGPVAPIILASDEKEAVDISNDTLYGLGTSMWTEDLDRAEKLSNIIQSDLVSVNNIVASDPRVPFGGIKQSGFGRELSRYGMLEFVNIKTIRYYDQLVHQHHVE